MFINYTNFEKHLSKIYADIYDEPVSSWHTKAARETMEEFCKDLWFKSAIELGCGSAPSLDILKEWGKETFGITKGNEVANHRVIHQDMHFTKIPNSSFDMVISRHVLEHSPMPLILLMEMERIARRYAVVVVPVPDKKMVEWLNHYSVLPRENWEWLFKLAGWKVIKFKEAEVLKEDDYTFKEYRYLLEVVCKPLLLCQL